jgi:hypothetical protein
MLGFKVTAGPVAACATVTETGYVCVALAPAPETVIVYVPVGTEELAATASVDSLPDATVAGLNVAVSPEGTFDALRVMFCPVPLDVAVTTL